MQIQLGYELVYSFPQATPMVLHLHIHHSRANDLVVPDHLITNPPLAVDAYHDSYGNWCSRIVAPAGQITLSAGATIRDSGMHESHDYAAQQVAVEDLPADTLLYLLPSRYCETDRLSTIAWQLFGSAPTGWARVQAVCDYVHQHLAFGYEHARPTKTAWEALHERNGVCRDLAHLAVALCRCLNIPARYCTGYLPDIGVPGPYGPMDFAAWFEAYLGGQWMIFDARNNLPRIGRVLMARGRDAADVAITNTFGPNTLESFVVRAEEIPE